MRRYHHGDLPEELLRVALVKIESEGTAALSLRDLARACGVSPAAPQRHFATKDEFFVALAIRGYHELGAKLARAETDLPVEAALINFTRAYLRFAAKHPVLLEVMYSSRFHNMSVGVAAASTAAFAPLDALLGKARERGEVIDDARLVGSVVRVMIRGLAVTVSSGEVAGNDGGLVSRAVEALLSGLRPR